jgi:predicted aspartyl protease
LKGRGILATVFSIVTIGCLTQTASEANAQEREPSGEAIVTTDTLTVYSGTSITSPAVKSLKKGDALRVALEIEGSEEAWCGIIEQGNAMLSGYVPCKYLTRAKSRERSWQHLGSSVTRTSDDATEVILADNQVLVPAALEYKDKTVEALLLLDTGASISLIKSDVADKLGITTEETKKGLGQVVGGGLILVFTTRGLRLTVGPHTKKGMEIGIVVHEGPPVRYDGLLGMDFLRNVRYTIDFEKHMIRWNQ